MEDGLEPRVPPAPPALVALRRRRVLSDPKARLRKHARIALLLTGLVALIGGYPIATLFAFLAWAGIGSVQIGGPRYPLVARRTPANPREAALVAMLPDRLLRRVDARTYLVEPIDDDGPLEIWQELSGLAEGGFDLTLGPEPRVTGQAERVGPLLDLELAETEVSEKLALRGRWLGWTTAPRREGLDGLVARARALRARLESESVSSVVADDVIDRGPPFLAALVMLADPEGYERSDPTAKVRPSWRWLSRDSKISPEARLRATRLLAHVADPDEVLARLHELDAAESLGGHGAAGAAAEHLGAPSHHAQIAAAALLEQIGTPAERPALLRARATHRAHRAELGAAVSRALAGIEARHGPVEAGGLAMVDDELAAGRLSEPDPRASEG